MKPYYLYKITNSINEKVYIGVTKNPKDRRKCHFFNRSQKSRSLIKNAIDKYGADNFEFILMCSGERDYIFDLEARAVEVYGAMAPHGYNIKPGGEGGPGHSVFTRVDDKPIYVTGFWFPNARTALKSLNIKKRSLYLRLKQGTAGELVWYKRERIERGDPVYVFGFWFPCIYIASEALKKPAPTLRKRVREGRTGEKQKPTSVPGENHYLFGKRGAECRNSKPVIIENVLYHSITEAVSKTGYSETRIRKNIKSGNPEFKYVQET